MRLCALQICCIGSFSQINAKTREDAARPDACIYSRLPKCGALAQELAANGEGGHCEVTWTC